MRNKYILLISLILNCYFLRSQPYIIQEFPLLDSISQGRIRVTNLQELDNFGYSVDIYGDFVFIGAPYNDEMSKDAGAVYFFVKTDSTWTFSQKLFSNDPDSNDHFGHTLSADRDYLIIGAPGDNERGENAGAVYSFKFIGNRYTQIEKLYPNDLNDGDNFGYSVSLDEVSFGTNFFIAGAPQKEINGVQSGAAYIFSRTPSSLYWSQNKKLAPFDTLHLTQAEFGYSVSIWGQSVLIGAPGDDSLETDAGAIYYLWRNSDEWLAKEKRISFPPYPGNRFGHCVRLTFEHALVGEPGSDFARGAAYLFRNTVVYGLYFLKRIIPNDSFPNDKFGFSLDLLDAVWGCVSVIGAPWKRNINTSHGAVYYFNSDIYGTTTQPFKVIAKDGIANDIFGFDIVMAADLVIVGVPFKFDNGIKSGAAYFLQTWHYEIPVEIISFEAHLSGRKTNIKWCTATETNNRGFEIERRTENSQWRTISFREGRGTTTEPQEYSFIDDLFEIKGTKLSYRLKQIDFNGTFKYSNTIEVEIPPSNLSLSQNYPNPFNPSTKISWQSPISSWQTLKIYDVLGNEVATLVNELKEAGNYEVEFNSVETCHGMSLPSGVYFYQLKAGEFVETKKMLLLR